MTEFISNTYITCNDIAKEATDTAAVSSALAQLIDKLDAVTFVMGLRKGESLHLKKTAPFYAKKAAQEVEALEEQKKFLRDEIDEALEHLRGTQNKSEEEEQ